MGSHPPVTSCPSRNHPRIRPVASDWMNNISAAIQQLFLVSTSISHAADLSIFGGSDLLSQCVCILCVCECVCWPGLGETGRVEQCRCVGGA